MSTISKLPGWFALFGGTDRSGRPGAAKAAVHGNGTVGIVGLRWLFAVLRRWQEQNDMRASIRNLDDRMLKDIGRTRADFDEVIARVVDDRATLASQRWPS